MNEDILKKIFKFFFTLILLFASGANCQLPSSTALEPPSKTMRVEVHLKGQWPALFDRDLIDAITEAVTEERGCLSVIDVLTPTVKEKSDYVLLLVQESNEADSKPEEFAFRITLDEAATDRQVGIVSRRSHGFKYFSQSCWYDGDFQRDFARRLSDQMYNWVCADLAHAHGQVRPMDQAQNEMLRMCPSKKSELAEKVKIAKTVKDGLTSANGSPSEKNADTSINSTRTSQVSDLSNRTNRQDSEQSNIVSRPKPLPDVAAPMPQPSKTVPPRGYGASKDALWHVNPWLFIAGGGVAMGVDSDLGLFAHGGSGIDFRLGSSSFALGGQGRYFVGTAVDSEPSCTCEGTANKIHQKGWLSGVTVAHYSTGSLVRWYGDTLAGNTGYRFTVKPVNFVNSNGKIISVSEFSGDTIAFGGGMDFGSATGMYHFFVDGQYLHTMSGPTGTGSTNAIQFSLGMSVHFGHDEF